MVYEIRIAGELGEEWSCWFGCAAIIREAPGVTLLAATLPDQPALHGLLHRVRDLGLDLISVTRREDEGGNK
jgi:hypothetical protein